MEDKTKDDTVLECPNCDEHNLRWDCINQIWQCLSCGYTEEA